MQLWVASEKGKQNNLRIAELMKKAITWNGLSEAIKDFLM